jgi:hypothetical protein
VCWRDLCGANYVQIWTAHTLPTPMIWPRFRFFIGRRPFCRPRCRPIDDTLVTDFHNSDAGPEKICQFLRNTSENNERPVKKPTDRVETYASSPKPITVLCKIPRFLFYIWNFVLCAKVMQKFSKKY